MTDHAECLPLVADSIATAHSQIKGYIHRTPLKTCQTINQIASHANPQSFFDTGSATPGPTTSSAQSPESGAPQLSLYFKCENQQKIGAFKARGAHYALLHLLSSVGVDEVKKRGVITHSSGNHAQALALAASTFEVPVYIIMPTISTPSKIAGVRKYTSNVFFSGSTAPEREAMVEKIRAETGAILVPPYDHPDIILGQGTTALEIEQQFRELRGSEERLDAVIVPCGGGGLTGGVATWFAGTETLVFGAEPHFQGANDGEIGVKQGKRVEHVSSLTIADGVRTPLGLLNWAILSDRTKLERFYSVSEDEIRWAMRLVMERMKEFVEPTAVVALAAVLFNREFRTDILRRQQQSSLRGPWNIAIVLSGGNTTMEAIAKLFGEGPASASSHTKQAEASIDGKIGGERSVAQVGADGSTQVQDIAG